MQRLFLLIFMLLFVNSATAAIELYPFSSEKQEQQFHKLTQQLRCPKCQNNSIADSNSMIAQDMRQKVFTLLQQGKTNQQITDFMIARYGHFISYQPPLNAITLWLWLLPLLFILIGVYKIWRDTLTHTLKNELPRDQPPS